MERLEVVDPHTGVALKVRPGSVQARLWAAAKPEAVEPSVEDETGEPETVKRKPGRPKKS